MMLPPCILNAQLVSELLSDKAAVTHMAVQSTSVSLAWV